jgi:PTS system ascorbate-specific IIC component
LWGVIAMVLIGAGILALGVAVQRKLVDTNWDPSPGRPWPTAGETAGPSVTSGRSYPKIPAPAGAPTPPPPPA